MLGTTDAEDLLYNCMSISLHETFITNDQCLIINVFIYAGGLCSFWCPWRTSIWRIYTWNTLPLGQPMGKYSIGGLIVKCNTEINCKLHHHESDYIKSSQVLVCSPHLMCYVEKCQNPDVSHPTCPR